jgi:hypothetical protein
VRLLDEQDQRSAELRRHVADLAGHQPGDRDDPG